MIYAVEAWSKPSGEDEEPIPDEMVESIQTNSQTEARLWAWERMLEGHFVCLYLR